MGIEGGHRLKDVFNMLRNGWKLIAAKSEFKWEFNIWRNFDEADFRYEGFEVREDSLGRQRVIIPCFGYYEVVDILHPFRKRYEEKGWFNHLGEEKIIFGHVPKEIEKIFEEVEWFGN